MPLCLVSLVHRPGERHPGLRALAAAASELGTAESWLSRPAGSWLPAADAELVAAAQNTAPASGG